MRWNVTQWGLVAHHCLCRIGPRYGGRTSSVNRLRWLRIVCVDIWALWRPGFLPQFLWVVSTDLIVVWRDYTNPLTVWFLEVAHYVDDSKWSKSLVGVVSTTWLWCVAHWNVWRHLQFQSRFAAYPLSFLCRRRGGPGKSFFVGSVSAMSSLHVITDVQMRGWIKLWKWKCPILSQIHDGYVIHVWHLRYGQELRQWE